MVQYFTNLKFQEMSANIQCQKADLWFSETEKIIREEEREGFQGGTINFG